MHSIVVVSRVFLRGYGGLAIGVHERGWRGECLGVGSMVAREYIDVASKPPIGYSGAKQSRSSISIIVAPSEIQKSSNISGWCLLWPE